jgi:transcriptional regulator with XRE-family HTH domain
MVNQEVIDRIVELRRQGYSIREIAKRVGVSHSTVWRILKKVEEDQKRLETSQNSNSTNSIGIIEQKINDLQTFTHGILEHVKTLETNITILSQDIQNIKTFNSILIQVARLRIEGPTRCKYIDDYGYCTKILLPECLPETKCLEVILGDGTRMYKPKVIENPIICLACPYYKPKKLI